MCKRAKFRGSPKALVTKLHKETFEVAPLMTGGIVTSLEILVIEMGDRGSKSGKACKRATSRRFFKV